MPKSLVKNWTIGRPLRLLPTLRQAQGTGSRNLYSREDLYRFALAKQLSGDGFSMTTLQRVTDFVGQFDNSKRFSYVVLQRKGDASPFINLIINKGPGKLSRSTVLKNWSSKEPGFYCLDTRLLLKNVDETIEALNKTGALKK
jgi:hypothetical protein